MCYSLRQKGLCRGDSSKDLERGRLPGGPTVIARVLIRERQELEKVWRPKQVGVVHPQAKKCRRPLAAGKGKVYDSSLEAPTGGTGVDGQLDFRTADLQNCKTTMVF